MKYAIVKCVNGIYTIHTEGITELSNAKTQFHGVCQTLWNAPDVINASVMIVDEHLNCVDMYQEYIQHETPSEV